MGAFPRTLFGVAAAIDLMDFINDIADVQRCHSQSVARHTIDILPETLSGHGLWFSI